MSTRRPVSFLVFSASLRAGSLNTKLAKLAAAAIERHEGKADLAAMSAFDAPSYSQDVQATGGGRSTRCHGAAQPARGQRRLCHRVTRVQWIDARSGEERHRLGISL